MDFGPLLSLEARGVQHHLHVVAQETNLIAIGMLPSLKKEQVEENIRKVMERWAS
jgi:hypothetical protein